MKWVKVFGLFVCLHIGAWIGSHLWLSAHPSTTLIVADTSFSMKAQFPAMRRWIDDHVAASRYTRVIVGTDKALIGPYEELRSSDAIFRTAFGRSSADSLQRYGVIDADTRVLLSDGSFDAPGWTSVDFVDGS